MSMDSEVFRRVMGCFATGVTVVATRQPDGKPCGLTANAVTSVSLVPPLVLVCVDKRSETYPHFATAGAFTVNMLTEDQRDLSSRFAVSGGEKFHGVGFHWGRNGAPIIDGCLAYLECRVVHAYGGGDHTIYVGEVETAGSAEGRPLLFYKGAYGSLADGACASNRSAPAAR
jgi:3-hydroxy-9,10-secoandrosta-1,3,5(10)-triene-9,17-dione monooxygenase reductase component